MDRIKDLSVILTNDFAAKELDSLDRLRIRSFFSDSIGLGSVDLWKQIPRSTTVLIRSKQLNSETHRDILACSRARRIDILGANDHLFLQFNELEKGLLLSGAYPKAISLDIDAEFSKLFDDARREFGSSAVFAKTEFGSLASTLGVLSCVLSSSGPDKFRVLLQKLRAAFPRAERVILKAFDETVFEVQQQYRIIFVRGALYSRSKAEAELLQRLESFANKVSTKLRSQAREATFALDLVLTKEDELKVVELKSIWGASLPDPNEFYASFVEPQATK